jgi:hypothetical protein
MRFFFLFFYCFFFLAKQPPIQHVLSTGILPTICKFLLPDYPPKIQFEACWAITNIASGTYDQTNEVVKCGAIPSLVKAIDSTNPEVCDQAIWALGYMTLFYGSMFIFLL